MVHNALRYRSKTESIVISNSYDSSRELPILCAGALRTRNCLFHERIFPLHLICADRLVHRHGPCARQPDQQLRGDGRGRGSGAHGRQPPVHRQPDSRSSPVPCCSASALTMEQARRS